MGTYKAMLPCLLLACIAGNSFAVDQDDQLDRELVFARAVLKDSRRLESRVLSADDGLHCVSFYTKLEIGPPVGLTVKLLDAEKLKYMLAKYDIKSKVQNDDTHMLKYFEVKETNKDFKVSLELNQPGPDTTVSVSDLLITQGGCLLEESTCDFEKTTCYLKNDNGNNIWKRIQPKSLQDKEKLFSPKVDFTDGSQSAYYMRARVSKTLGEASLVSRIVNATNTCIRFAYSIHGKGSIKVFKKFTGANQAKTFDLGTEMGQTYRNDPLPKWRNAQWSFTSERDEPFQILIKAEPSPDGIDSWISIDDIETHPRDCSYTPPVPTPPPSIDSIPPIRDTSCTFEWPKCSNKWTYTQSLKPKASFEWLHAKATETKGLVKFDKSSASKSGRFLYTEVPQSDVNANNPPYATLLGPKFKVNSLADKTTPVCVSFWYFMHGPQVPRLDLMSGSTILWSKEGNQGPAWHRGFGHLSVKGEQTLQLKFKVVATAPGSVAIDNVRVVEQECPMTDEVCDFNNLHTCGYTTGIWALTNLGAETGMPYDHSTSASQGILGNETANPGTYLYVDMDDTTKNNNNQDLISPMYPPTSARCLKFWYHIAKKDKTARSGIKLYRMVEEGDRFLYSMFFNSGDDEGWISAEKNFASDKYFQIVFSPYGSDSFINIDDIQFSETKCSDSYGCNFESGFCTWRNFNAIGSEENIAWEIGSGHLKDGPYRDVSINSIFGHYIYVMTTGPSDEGKKAVLASQEMNDGSCITFYTAAIGTDYKPLVLDLYTKENPTPVNILTLNPGKSSNPGRKKWIKATASLDKAFPTEDNIQDMWFRLSTELSNVTGSGWAVDQIEIHGESCDDLIDNDDLMVYCRDSKPKVQIKRSQECDFIPDCPNGEDEKSCGSCTFGVGHGWCRWMDVSLGQLEWTSSREVDQRVIQDIPDRPWDGTITKPGDFLVASLTDSDYPGPLIAELETDFSFGPSPSTCQMHFWFYITAAVEYKNIPLLRVVIREGGEDTVIYHDSFLTRNQWGSVTLDIGSIKSSFKIAILAQEKLGTQNGGQIAIDDIEFINCEYPPVQDTCTLEEQRCKRGSCIPHSQVCDFTDDCGDNSDEEDCESQIFTLRTNFEEGLGDWDVVPLTNDDGSLVYGVAATSWVIQSGLEGQQVDNEPGRDHTLGTLHGHYALFTNRRPGKIQSPVLISPTEDKQCHLRLYYYIATNYGRDDTEFNVYVKTSELGEDQRVFTKFTDHGQAWVRTDIVLGELHKPFKIILEGRGQGVLAIDDISLWGCMISSVQTLEKGVPPAPTTQCNAGQFQCGDGTCIPEKSKCDMKQDCQDSSDEQECGDCNFEGSTCGWFDDSLGRFSWQHRASAQQTEPSMDGTYGKTDKGHFIKLELHSAGVALGPALLYSPILPMTDPECHISFNYYTNLDQGDDGLIVGLQKLPTIEPAKFIQLEPMGKPNIQLGQWNEMKYYIGMLDRQGAKVVFTQPFKRFADNVSIAIDDIKFINCLEGSTIKSIETSTEPLECSFDDTLCDYHLTYNDVDDRYKWVLFGAFSHRHGKMTTVLQTGPWTDPVDTRVAVLTSNWIEPSDSELCLSFWYLTWGTTLTVTVTNAAEKFTPKYVFSHHSYEYEWHLGRANIPVQRAMFRVEFRSETGRNSEALQLADVIVKKEACAPKAVCDFEWDQCGYTLTGDRSWRRSDSYMIYKTDEPQIDRTNNNKYGHFMYVSKHDGLSGMTAGLKSPLFTQDTDSDSCLYFWYMLHGEDTSQLRVKKMKRNAEISVKLTEAPVDVTHKVWRQGRATIPRDEGSYMVLFEAVPSSGKLGVVALDDISMSLGGACPVPGTCTFDQDMCGYTVYNTDGEDDTEDPARWIRITSDRPISRYGPKEDQNRDFKNGGFAFADQFTLSLIKYGKTATMVSPYIPSTSEGHVSFWVYFDGPAEGMLKVLIDDNLHLTITAKNKEWVHKSFVYRSSNPHHLIFQAVRDSHNEASLAIDNIQVTHGHSIPMIPHTKKQTTKQPPKPADHTEYPVPPAIPASGSADNPDKTNCHKYCKHFKTCEIIKDDEVKCMCSDGYTGPQCDKQLPDTPVGPPKDISPHGRKPGSRANKADNKPASSAGAGIGPIIAIIVAVVAVLVLAFVVYVVLVRLKKVQAPDALQQMMPSLMKPPETIRGSSNPSYKYTNNPDTGDGIVNPVYGGTAGESDI